MMHVMTRILQDHFTQIGKAGKAGMELVFPPFERLHHKRITRADQSTAAVASRQLAMASSML